MVSRCLLGSALISSASALNWALVVTGSSTFNNYRHQADLCHAYQILVSKGFNKDRIVTMAYDDVAGHPENPFPGKLFNSPDPDGPGTDVYDGCNIDYKGDDVTASNFVSLLLGNATNGGNGRTLNTGPDDDLTLIYFDHGARGLIQFPAGEVLHATTFQATLKSMYDRNRYGRMVIYIEACNSGSMLSGLPTDMNIYGVTAVGSGSLSLATYCGYDAAINGKPVGACLGDLFSVFWMRFVTEGDGSQTLNQLFENVFDGVASFAALHYGSEKDQQHGDLSMGELAVGEFFYGDSQSDIQLATPLLPQWHHPAAVFAAPHLAMNRRQLGYSDASAQPLFHGIDGWRRTLQATADLQELLNEQKDTQALYWDLVRSAYPESQDQRHKAWTIGTSPQNAECEVEVHRALVVFCTGKVDLRTAYALQFHQVVVNLCNDEELHWDTTPERGASTARLACSSLDPSDEFVV